MCGKLNEYLIYQDKFQVAGFWTFLERGIQAEKNDNKIKVMNLLQTYLTNSIYDNYTTK